MNRNDIASLSWGRLLQNTADKVEAQALEIKELRKSQPSQQDQLEVKEQRAYRRSQRQQAIGLMGNIHATADDLTAIDTSALTKAQRRGLELMIQDKQLSERLTTVPLLAFDDGARIRMQNWKHMTADPQTNLTFNATDVTPEPPSRYERWQTNQKKPATQLLNQKRRQEAEDIVVAKRKLEIELKGSDEYRKNGIDFSNPN